MDFQTARNQFLGDCLENGNKDNTVRVYGSILDKFAKWCMDKGFANVEQMIQPHVDARTSSPRPLFAHHPKQRIAPLKAEEIRKILSVCNQQERLAMYLLLDTGIRFRELVNIHWNQVNIDDHVLHIQAGKGRDVVFSSATAMEFLRYRIDDDWTHPEGCVFRSQDGNLRIETMRSWFHRISKKSGKKVNQSILRKTFEDFCGAAGMPSLTLASLLGREYFTYVHFPDGRQPEKLNTKDLALIYSKYSIERI